MLVPIAYKSGIKGNLQTIPIFLDLDIPFAACIKFAFGNSRTGKVTSLCGEVGTKLAYAIRLGDFCNFERFYSSRWAIFVILRQK